MSMRRTNVYADPEDLEIIKAAARRQGISEAEIIRRGIHLAALASREWDEPFFSQTFSPPKSQSPKTVRDTVADAVLSDSEPDSAV